MVFNETLFITQIANCSNNVIMPIKSSLEITQEITVNLIGASLGLIFVVSVILLAILGAATGAAKKGNFWLTVLTVFAIQFILMLLIYLGFLPYYLNTMG